MSIAPVAEAERIQSLDVMRGFAVLGILAVNAIYFAAPWQAAVNPALAPLAVTGLTVWSWLVMHVVFEFKCITLFSLLFGASLCMVGGEGDDPARGALLRRRLVWLLVFGSIHGALIWYGDILITYALTGLLIMSARGWPIRTLMLVGVAMLLLSIALSGLQGLSFISMSASDLEATKAAAWSPPIEELQRIGSAYQAGLASALQENFVTWLRFLGGGLISLMQRTAGVMLIGMALFKSGFLSGKAPVWVYALMLATGAGALGLIAWQALINLEADFDFAHMHIRGAFANNALSIFGAIGYASLFVLLVKGGAATITRPLAAVGRMAFTNYITQSLIMTTIFWGGRGFGLFGEVDRATLWGIVVALWASQLIWSPLWLSRFQMGPLEWVWRRLSYGRPVAMARPG